VTRVPDVRPSQCKAPANNMENWYTWHALGNTWKNEGSPRVRRAVVFESQSFDLNVELV